MFMGRYNIENVNPLNLVKFQSIPLSLVWFQFKLSIWVPLNGFFFSWNWTRTHTEFANEHRNWFFFSLPKTKSSKLTQNQLHRSNSKKKNSSSAVKNPNHIWSISFKFIIKKNSTFSWNWTRTHTELANEHRNWFFFSLRKTKSSRLTQNQLHRSNSKKKKQQ